MEIPAVMGNILRHNGLLGYTAWMTLGSGPEASACFPGETATLVLGWSSHCNPLLHGAAPLGRAKLPYGILKISPNKSG